MVPYVSTSIDVFHNGDRVQYSFVLMLISLSNLSAMSKIQKNIETKVRPLGPIDHFTVVCLVAWPLNESETGVDLVLIETSLLFICKFILISMRTASLT